MPYTTTITGAEPVSLTEAKEYLRVFSLDEDDLIASLIEAAREWAETHTEKAIVEQTVIAYYDAPSRRLELPLGNATALTSVTNGSEAVNAKLLVGNPSVVEITADSLPAATGESQSVVVTYTAGYTVAPLRIKQAILLLVADMYENREAQVVGQTISQNQTLERLLFPVRELGL